MHHTEAHDLNWLTARNPDQLKWAVNYIQRKVPYSFIDPTIDNLTIHRINIHLNQITNESERKLIIIDMRNAWRAKTSRKNRKSNSVAFQGHPPRSTTEETSLHSDTYRIENPEYIESLVKNKTGSNRGHQEASENNNKLMKETIKILKNENATLKTKIKEAHKQIEYLKEAIEKAKKTSPTITPSSHSMVADLGYPEKL
ncbi:hypothetical protein [Pseudomonas citronellolis]|uniref:hypothetical protein n=1 Tax=Pseudomonas citronellolis TaxID=53408 RepID=UPI0021C0746C|nr:hypothetical protein [Pseudomonas citronellolis]UXJ50862.1 hypothetical protein N5P21_23140 [Pseudomonas citronellolis]